MYDMLINGKPLDVYGGMALLDYSVGSPVLNNQTFQGIDRTSFVLLKQIVGRRELRLTLVFTGADLHAAKLQKSVFDGLVTGKTELFIADDGFYYDAVCTSFGADVLIGQGDTTAQIKAEYGFDAVRRGPMQTETIAAGRSLWCKSTIPLTDVRLTATAGEEKTLSGASVEFKNTETPYTLASLSVDVDPVQSGTPSPSSPKPITGHTEANLIVNDVYKAIITDNAPYLFRASGGGANIGNREWDKLIGGTVAWNQLVTNGNFASASGWTANSRISISASNNKLTATTTAVGVGQFYRNITAPVAGHKYFVAATFTLTKEQTVRFAYSGNSAGTATLGVGTARNSAIFNLASVASQNANRFIVYTDTNGTAAVDDVCVVENVLLCDLTLMFGAAIADCAYTLESGTAGAGIAWLKSYGFFTEDYYATQSGKLESVNAAAHVMRDAGDTIIGNYPLDSSLTLRGIPKLDANNKLYYDGDTYESDGTVTRKYGTRAYQSGDATDGLTMITDGTNTVYKLTTPTTESATAFASPQTVDPDGTEQYADAGVSAGTRDVGIPVGHETEYFDGTLYKIKFGSTVYAGTLDFMTGTLKTRPYYASYNGETLVGPWLSSKDVYVAGTTPTTGAQVVDLGGTETTVSLSGVSVSLLYGENVVWADTGDVSLTLQSAIPSPFVLGGATFTGVSAGDVVVFDGIDGKITKNGVNAAGSASWVHFPQLTPGENKLSDDIDVTAEYYPTFV